MPKNKPLIYIYERALRGFDSPEHAQSQRTEAGVKIPVGRKEVAEQRRSRP